MYIKCEHIENSQHLTIISNGGNGSDGQEGGRGCRGKHGLSLKVHEMQNKYPSIVNEQRGVLSALATDNDQTIALLNQNLSELNNNSTITESRDEDEIGFYLRYREATKNTGNEIIFSYQGVTGMSSFTGNVTSIIPGNNGH